jgi:hypothetical protein
MNSCAVIPAREKVDLLILIPVYNDWPVPGADRWASPDDPQPGQGSLQLDHSGLGDSGLFDRKRFEVP